MTRAKRHAAQAPAIAGNGTSELRSFLPAIRTPWPACLPGTPASPARGAICTYSWCMRSNWADWGAKELLGDLSGLSKPLEGHYLSSFNGGRQRSGGGGRSSGKKRYRCTQMGEWGGRRGGPGAGDFGARLHRTA
jgi:hypothetical protein